MRTWSAYELTQLLRYQIDPDRALQDFPAELPVEYITGYVDFCGHVFCVNRSVLIPRVETEELVALAVQWIAKQNHKVRFTDVGTGSGAVAISIMLAEPERIEQGVLVDISLPALAVARLNATRLLGSERNYYQLIKSDLLPNQVQQLDLIVANLPYVPSSRIGKLAASVKDFEPHLALDGGDSGLDLISRLLKQAETKLAPGGVVMLEVDDTHTDPSQFINWQIEVLSDFAHKTRFWIAKQR
jgi:release factor glutamine methyltransferase